MTPMPFAADAPIAAPPSPGLERTRRNIACINCRNSKVRCKASQVPGEPCQRCAKQEISCVVDKTHRRVTRRSKLEQLEQELKNIKQTVDHRVGGVNSNAQWAPPSPHTTVFAASSERTPTTALPDLRPPSIEASLSVLGPHGRTISRSAQARVLDRHAISGGDIDYYFNKFLEVYHPFLPILRQKVPDECYDACPTLFWVILFVVCRRYARDNQLFDALVAHVTREIWTMMATNYTSPGLEEIHALLLLASWPPPTIRFVNDPSATFASLALNSAMLLGLHTGRGSHREFIVGLRKDRTSTDEEASATWVASCAVAQRMASGLGHPPPFIQFNDSQCKKALASTTTYWDDLVMMYDVQRFVNRFTTAMTALIAAGGVVPESVVSGWESEFEVLRPLMIPHDTEMSRFMALAAKLEIQTYYFLGNSPAPPPQQPSPSITSTPPPPPPPPINLTSNFRVNTIRVFNTSRALITLAIDLESRSKLLTHAPNWVFRSVVEAAHVTVFLLHSHCLGPADPSPADAHILAQQASNAILHCSYQDSDLPHRASVMVEAFWCYRNLHPKFDAPPVAWSNRLGIGVTFGSMELVKRGLLTAQKSTDGVNRALEMIQPQTEAKQTSKEAATSGEDNQPETSIICDPFQDMDWSMFMDDFGWNVGEGVLLGMPE